MSDATAANPGPNVVDYDDVISRYEQSLNTVLRGFRGGARFLESWVHDPEHSKSILNMIEAARADGLTEVTVVLGAGTVAAIDLDRLRALAAPLGSVLTTSSGSGLALKVTFGAGGESGSSGGAEAYARAQRAREERDARLKASAAANAAETLTEGELPEVYVEALRTGMDRGVIHEGAVGAAPEQVTLATERDGARLEVAVNPVDHTVVTARHSGATNEVRRGLLEGLCAIMEAKPLLECADHAVIRLEYSLRDRSQPRPVRGILTPESTPGVFGALTTMVRDLLAQYRKRTGFAEVSNRWDPPPAAGWRDATHGQRLQQIQAALDALVPTLGLVVGDIVCTRLDKNTRVTVELRVDLSPARKPPVLRALEVELKRRVEATLHVYQEEMHDKNKLRRL